MLTAQYVDYFYYSGQNSKHMACNLRPDRIPHNPTVMKNHLKTIGKKAMYLFNILRRRQHAAVEPDDEGDGGDEESQSQQEHVKKIGHSSELPIHKDKQAEEAKKDGIPAPGVVIFSKATLNLKTKSSDEKDDNNEDASSDGMEDDTAEKDAESLDTFEREMAGPPVEMVEWTCMVCCTYNPATPKIPLNPPEMEYYFGTHGVHYKRMFVKIVPKPHKPTCKKCFTPYDYTPPVGSAHVFPHNPDPYVAFRTYPPHTRIFHGIVDTKLERFKNSFLSFLFGIQKSFETRPMENDWRLRKYVADKFPPVPRYVLKEGERYELGEIVECKLQKFEYCRARIINARPNNSYDIRYDAGDELRFVPPASLRLGAEKGAFAYRVEIAMVGLYIAFPLGLLLAVMSSNPGLAFVGPLVIGLGLFLIRLDNFLQYVFNYGAAGLCVILRATAFFTLAPFFVFVAGAIGLAGGQDLATAAGGIAALFILAFVFTLPVLYVIRPPYALLGALVFVQASIGLALLSMHFSTNGAAFLSIGIPLAPFLTTTLFLKYVRVHLHAIWDVCLVIRPALAHPRRNMWTALYKNIRATIRYYLP